MFNATLTDGQKVTIHAGPHTASSPGTGANAYAFQAAILNADNADNLLVASAPAGTVSDPTFTVQAARRFFGTRVFNLRLQGINDPAATPKITPMTVTLNGTLPDDGTLDHFEPTAEAPVAL